MRKMRAKEKVDCRNMILTSGGADIIPLQLSSVRATSHRYVLQSCFPKAHERVRRGRKVEGVARLVV